MHQMIQTGAPSGRVHCCQHPATPTRDVNDHNPNVVETLRNNRGNNSNFARPCKELAYLTRTVMHASALPYMPAKRGKLTTVPGRVLSALQLQLFGHSEGRSFVAGKFFVPCDSVIVGRVLQAQRNFCEPFPSCPTQLWLH